jgi:hypothetical protein
MSTTPAWIDANQARVLAGLAELRVLLEAHATGTNSRDEIARARAAEQAAIAAMPARSTLDRMAVNFGLSDFERRLLLLCAGVELDASIGRLCAQAQGDAGRAYATFSLALAALPDAHWSAIAPQSPLRRWRLIDVLAGDALVTAQLRIEERVLHTIVGVSSLDDRLVPLLREIMEPPALAPSHAMLARRVVDAWGVEPGGVAPVVELCGRDAGAARAVAATACATIGAHLFAVTAVDLPAAPAERDLLRTLLERETALDGAMVLVETYGSDREAVRIACALIDATHTPLLVSGRDPVPMRHRTRIRIDVSPPSAAEQASLWRSALGDDAGLFDGQVKDAVAHFRVGVDAMTAATAQVRASLANGNGSPPPRLLWNACRVQVRPRLDDLAQRIEPAATWDDLVLPPAQIEILRQITASVAHRATVYEAWGFASRGSRGLGVSAMFAGASGTGKTMAAEVVAHALDLDLYRIDLSQVVSKYIGETEKNLSRVFDAAEEGGVVLLFDEADALFGKRTEVKDSHDRYANVETSYLLQRMEAYRGLAVLTTNLKSALDAAFLRRIRFVVQFPFPDLALRAEIWRRVFPPATPREGLDPARLARLNIAGGNIRNIALNAAFLAAAGGSSVRMEHILRAARSEYAKLEKPLTDSEVAGWL